jgi:hypothetical protein
VKLPYFRLDDDPPMPPINLPRQGRSIAWLAISVIGDSG